MRTDIHLFIGKKEVEFNGDPKILFNFKITELNNPTIIKNSWTKTVTIPSTPANDDIFNHFWNLERVNGGGVNFNPTLKTDFELYINNTLIQNGYCKLDSVKVSNHNVQYQVSLFGGLGDFFYNLSYAEGDTTDVKKTLASLNFADGVGAEPNLDFIINKDTVNEAWEALMGTGQSTPDDKWDVVNFAPVYNGIPEDFDAGKAVINNKGLDSLYFKVRASGDTDTPDYYKPIINGVPNLSGYSLGELSEELTVDETRDLRSYLNRPVVNVYRTIQACCNPENNGGYQVKLDPHFFHVNNPYYYGHNAWVTLPMLRQMEVQGGQSEEVTGATITNINKNVKTVNYNVSSLSEVNNLRMRMNVGLNTTATGYTLYTYFNYSSDANTLNANIIRNYTINEGVCLMLVGRDNSGTIVAQSKESYCLSSYQYNPAVGGNLWNGFSVPGYPTPRAFRFLQGKWVKKNGQWVWCDMNNNQVDIEFTFNNSTPLSSIELVVQIKAGEYWVQKVLGQKGWQSYPDESDMMVWPTQQVSDHSNRMETGIKTTYGYVAVPTYNITDFYCVATDYEAFFSNTYIPKDRLLSTSYSPADFLISYCKMFGLYFYRNPSEVADDTYSCPKGVIHIMDRNTFYTGEYVDLQSRIDRSKDINITPTMAGSKWYSFDLEHIDSEAGAAYKTTYGYNYGRQLINTNYNFDSNTTNIYDGNAFKAGVMVREKDKYFCGNYRSNPRSRNIVPNFALNGLKVTLFHPSSGELETYEYDINPIGVKSGDINDLGLKRYDSIPKLQCHTDDNSPADGDGVLLFYNGPQQTVKYWITDDIMEMETLNGGNPCWIMTAEETNANEQQIAIPITTIPRFTRDKINFGQQEGNIIHSWNFGHPQVTFVPNTYTTEGDSIYDKCWKAYISDLYDANNKKITAFVNLQGIPTNAWLRRWYWFDNGVWRLNEIKEWNAADPSTTQCEFIKVMDVNNYKLDAISEQGVEGIILEKDIIAYSGETVNGTINLQSGGQWFTWDDNGVITGVDEDGNTYTQTGAISPVTGSGMVSQITVTFPPSSAVTPITWTICVEDDFDQQICTQVVQQGSNASYLRFTNSSSTLTFTGGTKEESFTMQNMVASSITVSTADDWLSATLDVIGKIVTISADTYSGGSDRTTTVYLAGLDINNQIVNTRLTVYQLAPAFDINPRRVYFDYDEDMWTDRKIVNITSTGPWGISYYDRPPED